MGWNGSFLTMMWRKTLQTLPWGPPNKSSALSRLRDMMDPAKNAHEPVAPSFIKKIDQHAV
jgi:hypothetical protein